MNRRFRNGQAGFLIGTCLLGIVNQLESVYPEGNYRLVGGPLELNGIIPTKDSVFQKKEDTGKTNGQIFT